MLLSSVACGGSGGEVSTTAPDAGTTAPTETANPLAEPELPAKDYEGCEFTVLTAIEGWGIYNNEHIVTESENGDILNDAIYARNRHTEEKFNIKLVEVNSSSVAGDIRSSVMSGDDAYDLVIPTTDPGLGPEFLVDFRSLDYLSLDKPWWNQNYTEANTINGKLTTAISSLMITHMDSVLGMLFNKKLAEDYSLPDIYELVRGGAWTLAKYFEISKGTTKDLNGDTELTNEDHYAFLGLDGIVRLASGVQIKAIEKDSDGLPTLSVNDSVINAVSKIREYATQYKDEIYDARGDSKTVFQFFTNDQALFYVHGLGSVQQFRDMKSDFGIIPTPKLDGSQERYFIAPDCTKCLAVPITAEDLERTAIILEYMSWDGYVTLRPRYYESMLQSKYVRDEESIEMMDEYIFTNIGFGLSTTTLSSVIKATPHNSNGRLARRFFRQTIQNSRRLGLAKARNFVTYDGKIASQDAVKAQP